MDKIERTMSLLITIFAISFIVFSIMSLFKPVTAFAAVSAVTCEFTLLFLGGMIFVYDGQKEVGLFCWNYKKKKWQFENAEGKSKFYRGEMK